MVGGIAGYITADTSVIQNNYSFVNIQSAMEYLGGIVGIGAEKGQVTYNLALGNVYTSKSKAEYIGRVAGDSNSLQNAYAYENQLINGSNPVEEGNIYLLSKEKLLQEVTYTEKLRFEQNFDYSQLQEAILPKLKNNENTKILPNQSDLKLEEHPEFQVQNIEYEKTDAYKLTVRIELKNAKEYPITNVVIENMNAASKIIEGDHLILQKLELDENEHEAIEHLIVQMEKERGLDRSAAIADMRFNFIEKVCEKTVVKPKASRERIRSEKIDRILTGKYTAIPCFIGIMLLVFFLTFHVIGAFLQNLLAMGIDALSNVTDRALTAAGVNEVLHGLIIDGIFAGVGSVLSFLPIIVTLFFFLSLMEDSGYIARVAFFMDKLLRKIGLSGRSIVPMLIGFGCTVPAVMSTRTLPSERDRKMTILLTPFMSCSAKLPIYAFFTSAFFPEYGAIRN